MTDTLTAGSIAFTGFNADGVEIPILGKLT